MIVAANQLSLAIGHKGQNVRLASKLIGYKINIVANEDEELSIDKQLEKELAKSRENENSIERTSKELDEGINLEEAENDAETLYSKEEQAEDNISRSQLRLKKAK